LALVLIDSKLCKGDELPRNGPGGLCVNYLLQSAVTRASR